MSKQGTILRFSIFIAILIVLNVLASGLYTRFDLTKEKRFTLSDATIDLIEGLDDVVYIEVYLQGDFPAGFKRLQSATRDMLSEFRSNTGNTIEFTFVNPLESVSNKDKKAITEQLMKKGLQPVNLKVEAEDAYSERLIFPGALVKYKGREEAVHLLESQRGFTAQEALNHSVEMVEYKMAKAINKLANNRRPKVAFLTGHAEMAGPELEDVTKSLEETYEIGALVLKEVLSVPKSIDVIIVAGPREPFDEQDKYKLDQYVMNGGKIIWFIESLRATMDSLRDEDGAFLALDYSLNLEDQLFKYGVRLNANLIQDLHCNQIPVVVGMMGDDPQTQMYPWIYFPVLTPRDDHPIVKNLDLIATKFVGTIDTIGAPGVKKTILLSTSEYSRSIFSPVRVHLQTARVEPDRSRFTEQHLPVAVLLEGEFSSVFKNRFTPEDAAVIDSLSGTPFKEKSVPTKMIVVADGDLIRNDVGQDGRTYPLGFYRFTNQTFANKDFIWNAIEYLTDQSGLIETRSKEVKLRLLDRTKLKSEKVRWEMINIVVPISFILLFGAGFNYLRRRRYVS